MVKSEIQSKLSEQIYFYIINYDIMKFSGFTAEVALINNSDYSSFPFLYESSDLVMPAAAMQWGEFDRGTCRDGFEGRSAILWDIPAGWDWLETCRSTEIVIDGIPLGIRDHCVHTGFNVWGVWYRPCGSGGIPGTVNHVVRNPDGSTTYHGFCNQVMTFRHSQCGQINHGCLAGPR
jgi:hypothetical protein